MHNLSSSCYVNPFVARLAVFKQFAGNPRDHQPKHLMSQWFIAKLLTLYGEDIGKEIYRRFMLPYIVTWYQAHMRAMRRYVCSTVLRRNRYNYWDSYKQGMVASGAASSLVQMSSSVVLGSVFPIRLAENRTLGALLVDTRYAHVLGSTVILCSEGVASVPEATFGVFGCRKVGNSLPSVTADELGRIGRALFADDPFRAYGDNELCRHTLGEARATFDYAGYTTKVANDLCDLIFDGTVTSAADLSL